MRYIVLISHLLGSRKKASSLIIDYGEEAAFSNSLRGILKQRIYKDDDILKYSGECDLSAYVNFQMLKNVIKNFRNLQCRGVLEQGIFLELLGIKSRYSFIV